MQQVTFKVSQENASAYHQSSAPYYVQAGKAGQIMAILKQDDSNHAPALSSAYDWETFMNELEYE